jgi:hypothetical protein
MPQQRDIKGRFVKLGEGIEKRARANVIKMASMILQSVVTSTPVDTGHARANWQVGIGEEHTDELAQEDKSGQATISAGTSILQTHKPGDTIHISNNVPYIDKLNRGWSAQAPAGFIEKAINTALAAFKGWKIVK